MKAETNADTSCQRADDRRGEAHASPLSKPLKPGEAPSKVQSRNPRKPMAGLTKDGIERGFGTKLRRTKGLHLLLLRIRLLVLSLNLHYLRWAWE
eukprot:9487844-Pyramimonas_sp.AAC.1